jgi:hypothetical protein
MSMSVRRLLVSALVAVLGGGATAQAVAKPTKKPSKHGAARKASAKKPRPQAHAVKLDAGVAWVPLAALAGAPPLTGTTGAPARPGNGSGSLATGSVVVQLHNQGEDEHNLRVIPTDHAGATVDFPLTGSGQNTTKTLNLTAGSYRLFCTLTTPVNHETAGMNATLTVS